jgi:hypothetical protein
MRRFYSILISSILVTFLIPSISFSERGIKVNRNEIVRDGRFMTHDNGAVKDTLTGLMWAAKDNGKICVFERALTMPFELFFC